jgi:hypothetical protein
LQVSETVLAERGRNKIIVFWRDVMYLGRCVMTVQR